MRRRQTLVASLEVRVSATAKDSPRMQRESDKVQTALTQHGKFEEELLKAINLPDKDTMNRIDKLEITCGR